MFLIFPVITFSYLNLTFAYYILLSQNRMFITLRNQKISFFYQYLISFQMIFLLSYKRSYEKILDVYWDWWKLHIFWIFIFYVYWYYHYNWLLFSSHFWAFFSFGTNIDSVGFIIYAIQITFHCLIKWWEYDIFNMAWALSSSWHLVVKPFLLLKGFFL